MDSSKSNTPSTTPFHIDLADTSAFSASYCGGAPSPILLAYGAGALHRVVQRDSDRDHEKTLQSDYSLAEIFNADPMTRRETPRVGFAA